MKKNIRTNRIVYYCIIAVIIVTTNLVYANPITPTNGPLPEPKLPAHNSTAIILIKNKNCTQQQYSYIQRRITHSLSSIRYYAPVQAMEITRARKKLNFSNRCINKQCVKQLAKEIPAQKIITGLIQKVAQKRERLMGQEGKEKYLLQTRQNITFIITLSLIDGVTGATLKRIRVRTTLNRLYKVQQNIIKQFQPFYTEPPKPKPVVIIKPKPEPVPPPLFVPALGIQCIVTQPLDRFSNIVTRGLGLTVEGEGKELYQTNFFAGVNMRFSSFFIKNSDINYFVLSSIGLKGGYEFLAYPKVSLSPWFTTGYILHRIDDNYRGQTYNYYDPFIEMGGTFSYQLQSNLSLTLSPSYVLFFEKSGDTGSYMQIGSGVTILF